MQTGEQWETLDVLSDEALALRCKENDDEVESSKHITEHPCLL